MQAGAGARGERQAVAVELGALEPGGPQQVACAARLAAGLRDRLAALARDRRRQVLDPRVGEVARAAQDGLALVAGRTALVRGAAHRARQRPFDVLERADGHGVDHFAAVGAAQLFLPRSVGPFTPRRTCAWLSPLRWSVGRG